MRDSVLATGWYYVSDNGKGFRKNLYRSKEYYFLDPHPILLADYISSMSIEESDWEGKHSIILVMHFDEEGTEKWSHTTSLSIGKRLAFIIDNKMVEAPEVENQITSGVSALNSGNYSKEELEAFQTQLEKESGKGK